MDVWGAWERLGTVRELSFEARSLSATNSGWNGSGVGAVEVEPSAPLTLIFLERGTWTPRAVGRCRFGTSSDGPLPRRRPHPAGTSPVRGREPALPVRPRSARRGGP